MISYDKLVAENKIPDDVKVQVLTQCRQELVDRTFEAIQGIKNVVVHIYNSTSTLQRDVVFNKSQDEIIDIAIAGTRMVKEHLADFDGNVQLEYSPESFTGTEVDFALRICTAVQKEWDHATDAPIIFNLPATVEMNTPNVYADQIEWMSTVIWRIVISIILSVHPHNDRGTGVAIAELALLAGADRVEGTLFGNGERTGNVDILTVAYNMFSQGINPELGDRAMSRRSLRSMSDAARCMSIRVILMPASWYLPLFPDPIRMPSIRAYMRCRSAEMNIGKSRIFRSIRQTLAENMSRWFVSTASPARAALPL